MMGFFVPLTGWLVAAGGITFVDSATGGPSSASITLPGGMQENDLVLVGTAMDNSSPAVTTPTGYTAIYGPATFDSIRYQIAYKFMPSTPDTTASGLCNHGFAIHGAMVFRGVDTSTPLDVAVPAVATNTTGNPDSPSITPVTDGCAIISVGWLDDDDVSATVPSGYTLAPDPTPNTGVADANQGATLMLAYLLQETAAAENPGAWGGAGSDVWAAGTIALRPA